MADHRKAIEALDADIAHKQAVKAALELAANSQALVSNAETTLANLQGEIEQVRKDLFGVASKRDAAVAEAERVVAAEKGRITDALAKAKADLERTQILRADEAAQRQTEEKAHKAKLVDLQKAVAEAQVSAATAIKKAEGEAEAMIARIRARVQTEEDRLADIKKDIAKASAFLGNMSTALADQAGA